MTYLYHENQRLRAMIAHMKDGGCHAAHPGEITSECSPHLGGTCWACRTRAALETIANDHNAHAKLFSVLGCLDPGGKPRPGPECASKVLEWAQDIAREALDRFPEKPEDEYPQLAEPEGSKTSLRYAIRLVVDAAETLSSAAGYEPDGEGGMNHRGMCQQELDAVERVKDWLGPRPLTREVANARRALGGYVFSFHCPECDEHVFERAGNAFRDGETETCEDCGAKLMISCDAESGPYVVVVEGPKSPSWP